MPEQCIKRARGALRFGSRAVIHTNGDAALAATLAALLRPSDESLITIDGRQIKHLTKAAHGSSVTVTLDDDEKLQHGFLTHVPFSSPNISFASKLGLTLSQSKMEVSSTGPFYEATDVKGCFVAGDLAIPAKAVISGINSGLMAAVGVSDQLQNEE